MTQPDELIAHRVLQLFVATQNLAALYGRVLPCQRQAAPHRNYVRDSDLLVVALDTRYHGIYLVMKIKFSQKTNIIGRMTNE